MTVKKQPDKKPAPAVQLTISERLRAALPPLTEDELKGLEENLVADGRVFNPICYWNDGEKNVVIDGMNRLPIASRLKIPFVTKKLEFADYDAAEKWIKTHALHQRNLTPEQKRRLVGELYNKTKGTRGGNHKQAAEPAPDGSNTRSASLPKPNAAEEIGKAAGVHPGTVVRAGKVVDALNVLSEPMRLAIEGGTHPATDKIILALSKLNPQQRATLWSDVRTSRQPSWEAAMKAHGHIKNPAKNEEPASVFDNIPKGLHAKLKELKSTPAELAQLAALNMDDQRSVVDLIDGVRHKTLGSALGSWHGPVSDTSAEETAKDTRARHLNGMKATIDTMRQRIDEIVASAGGRPNPDYAQQALDGLDAARIALAKWARKA